MITDKGEYYPLNVNDIITMPTEPPVGTVLEVTGKTGKFRITRDDRGWYIASAKSTRLPWRIVCEMWLPARIVKLPEMKS